MLKKKKLPYPFKKKKKNRNNLTIEFENFQLYHIFFKLLQFTSHRVIYKLK